METHHPDPLIEPLTRRERQILILLAKNLTYQEIAAELTLAPSSVKWYVHQIYGKLGVSRRWPAIQRASELGLLSNTHATPPLPLESGQVQEIPFSKEISIRSHNLPSPISSFIGREAEIEQIKQLMHPQGDGFRRLVTLTGPGGVGKTRLALRAAGELRGAYPHGVWLVELAPLADPNLVPQATAAVFHLRENPGQDFTGALVDCLRPKQLLLVLDNCEHLVEACARLAETLLLSCPGLAILATSRASLGLDGEQAYFLPSLPSPDPEHLPPLEEFSEYAAVKLFVERAAAASPGFLPTAETAVLVAQVCQRLDGIPLALELAAARLRVLDIGQVAARLEDRFRLLAGGSRTVLPKNQTVRTSIDWSYNLLSEAERALLQRLSVFAGGWTLEAAESVCADHKDENSTLIVPSEVLDLLASLVIKSLVVVEHKTKGRPRYRLLESIREYAVERLEESSAAESFRKRHADYFLGLVVDAEPRMHSAQASAWLDRLDADYGNIRSALSWSLSGGAVAAGQGATPYLLWYWFRRNNVAEGRAWLHKALAQTRKNARSHTQAELLNAAGTMAWFLGDLENAQIHLKEGLALSTELAYKHGIAMANLWLFLCAARHGQEMEDWLPLTERSLALFREPGEEWWLGLTLWCVGGVIADYGDTQKGLSFLEEGEKLFRRLGDTYGLSYIMGSYGKIAWKTGDLRLARERYREGLALKRQFGDRWGTAQLLYDFGSMELGDAKDVGSLQRGETILEECLLLFRDLGTRGQEIPSLLYSLGCAALAQGHRQRAGERFKESLAFGQQGLMENPYVMAEVLLGPVEFALGLDNIDLAARLLGAIEAVYATVPTVTTNPRFPDSRVKYERFAAVVRSQLNAEEFKFAWVKGQTLSLDEAVAEAIAFLQIANHSMNSYR